MKILWMPETFIVYRRIYGAVLRNRLADRYITVTKHDCDLTSEWWKKFKALAPEKREKAKAIITLNKFKEAIFIIHFSHPFKLALTVFYVTAWLVPPLTA